MGARLLELAGIRALYLGSVAVFGGEPLEPAGKPTARTRGDLAAEVESARLYLGLNLGRIPLYFPQLWAVWAAGIGWAVAWIVASASLHAALALVEVYRIALARDLARRAAEGPATPPKLAASDENSRGERFFRPREFELRGFYRRLGIEYFRRFTVWLMSALHPDELRFVTEGGTAAAAAFERQTRPAETVHWALAATMVPTLVGTAASGWVLPAAWALVMLLGDTYLALLQRHMRARVWRLVVRARRAAA